MNYKMTDITKELTVNEGLRLFRALFFQGRVPVSSEMKPIFDLYHSLIMQGYKEKLTLSTWLTVIETCRHGQEGLQGLLELSK